MTPYQMMYAMLWGIAGWAAMIDLIILLARYA